jgi:TrmH family RNA methyltransferase
MELITSRHNLKIKQARLLRKSPSRRSDRLFLVEGIHHVGEALEASSASTGFEVTQIIYAPDQLKSAFANQLVESAWGRGIPCHATTLDVFESVAGRENPQGILAVARYPERSLDEFNPDRFEWGVALVEPQDPGNIGTILRTIDAVGASGLILLDGGADPYHPNAVRASMGVLFWYPIVSTSFDQFIAWSKSLGYTIYGTSAHGDAPYRAGMSYSRPCILLMGSERQGLSEAQREFCDQIISLSMKGRATSLNLAVATGVILYDMQQKYS